MRFPGPARRRRAGLRGWLIALALLLVVLFLSARGVAGFYTDYLWFDSLGRGDVWRRLILARVVPALLFATLFFVVMAVSLTIADRLAPRGHPVGPEDELLARYRASMGAYQMRIRLGVSAFFAIVAGGSAAGEWRHWLLFINRVRFGQRDPQFGRDIGFYVFELPFLAFVFDWLFAALVIVLVVTAVAHYLNGGIRVQSPFQRVTPQVKAHLSVLLALMALAKTGQYALARYELNFSSRGVVNGAGKTDVAAHLPALNLLMVISVVAAGLFVWNIWRRGWVLPVIAVGLWAFVSLVIGTVVPALYQQVRVEPNELAQERRYIARNIRATRAAFGLAGVRTQRFEYQADLDVAELERNAQTIDNARLWDTPEALRNYQSFQGFQTFYTFVNADVDRYTVDGTLRQVLIAARELNQSDLPSQSWVNRRIVYTHGYGMVVSRANDATAAGRPEFLLSNIPPDGQIDLRRPELYFGENLTGYALVGARQPELDFRRPDGREAFGRYQGRDGVRISSFLRRGAFALRFADWSLLVSGQVRPSSRVLFMRDVRDRVRTLAPFLHLDDDAYPAVVRGRVLWVLDGYTASDSYPYSQRFTQPSGGIPAGVNYVRNSVKVTVDAYDGTVRFYVVDRADPVLRAWRKAFPRLFHPMGAMPEGLREHLRYPQDLFRVQTDVFRAYHMTNPTSFYNKADLWEVSRDPGTGPVALDGLDDVQPGPTTTTREPQAAASAGRRIDPLYVLIRLPDRAREEFILIRPFVPVSRGNVLENLVAFMTASSEPDSYGQLRAFVIPPGVPVEGPVQVDSAINNNVEISEQYTLLSRSGSLVVQGSLQLIPVGNSLLYIRPVYVQAQAGQQLPAFRFVIVYYNGKAFFAPTVRAALASFPEFSGLAAGRVPNEPGSPGPAPPEPAPGTEDTLRRLLDEAARLYEQAQAALADRDLGRYQELVDRLGEVLRRAREAAGAGAPGAPGTTTTTTATRPPGGRTQALAVGTRR